MKVVETLVVRDEADVLDAHLAYQLNAGVETVVANDPGTSEEASRLLREYARTGSVHVVPGDPERPDDEVRTELARLAAAEHGADWIVDSSPDVFWWPRAESLEDALAAIPARYTIVQALVRTFLPALEDGRPFAERMTLRRRHDYPADAPREPVDRLLRPVYRARPGMVIGRAAADTRHVPLRAWYPIEALSFPQRSSPADGTTEQADAEGSAHVDTRLRDALRTLAAAEGERPGAYALPAGGASRLVFDVPNVVADAAYAVECAAVGEVDLPRLEAHLAALETRIAQLEQRFWPRVRRRAFRLVRRSRS